MRRQQRPTWYRWAWITAAIVLVFSLLLWYHNTQSPLNSVRNQAIAIAKDKGKLTEVDDFYWDNHSQPYYTVAGKTQKQTPIFVLIRQKNGHVTIINQKSGISRQTAMNQAQEYFKPKKILTTALTERKKQLVWDIGFIDSDGKLGYVSYSFKTGNQVRAIRNI